MKMKDEFTELYKDAGFGSIRYPGGTISNLFRWKDTIGDKEDRVNQIHGFYNNPNQGGIAPNFGLTEVADFAYRDDVQSEIVYVYGFGRGSAQDAADLVEYLQEVIRAVVLHGQISEKKTDMQSRTTYVTLRLEMKIINRVLMEQHLSSIG